VSTIKIGGAERSLEDVSESWVNEQVNQRKMDHQSVCVLVRLQGDGVDMVLSTPSCGSGGGGGRPPNPKEEKIFHLWDERGLNTSGFSGGNVVAFLKQATKLI